jgi:hypothetical protein
MQGLGAAVAKIMSVGVVAVVASAGHPCIPTFAPPILELGRVHERAGKPLTGTPGTIAMR